MRAARCQGFLAAPPYLPSGFLVHCVRCNILFVVHFCAFILSVTSFSDVALWLWWRHLVSGGHQGPQSTYQASPESAHARHVTQTSAPAPVLLSDQPVLRVTPRPAGLKFSFSPAARWVVSARRRGIMPSLQIQPRELSGIMLPRTKYGPHIHTRLGESVRCIEQSYLRWNP